MTTTPTPISPEDLKKIKAELDAMPPIFAGRGPLYPYRDENGVVHLQDEKGVTYFMMNEVDYQDLVKYKEDNDV